MSITVDLDPALEAGLRKKAVVAGLSLEEYVRKLAESDVAIRPKLSRREVDEIIESFRGKMGPIPENALDPKYLYEDD